MLRCLGSSCWVFNITVGINVHFPPPDDKKHAFLSSHRLMNSLEMFVLMLVRVFRIPADIEYTHDRLPSMSSEELEKLNTIRPETFAAASQMQGITPHSLVYLYNHVTRRSKVRVCLFLSLETARVCIRNRQRIRTHNA